MIMLTVMKCRMWVTVKVYCTFHQTRGIHNIMCIIFTSQCVTVLLHSTLVMNILHVMK